MQRIEFDSLESTNETAKRMLAGGDLQEPTYIIAYEQTRGKGTRGRSWCSPRDAGLYLTVVDPNPRALSAETVDLTLAAGVACVEALLDATGAVIQLKPINDLYVDGRKLGGILTECSIQGATLQSVITGIGINVAIADRPVVGVSPVCLEELLTPSAYALLDRAALAQAIAETVLARQEQVHRGKVDRIRDLWRRYAVVGAELPASR